MSLAVERATLVNALSSVAVLERRRRMRRFLDGLSTEELRYIAGYLGACMIESSWHYRAVPRAQIACEILHYEGYDPPETEIARWNRPTSPPPGVLEHRMILLLEYLSSCHCGTAAPLGAGSA